MKKYIIISLFAFFAATLTSSSVGYPKHQFGLGYSMISGAGLEYQIEFNMHSAFKFHAIAYYSGEKPPYILQIVGIAGAEYQYNLSKNKDIRNYLFLGASAWHFEDRDQRQYYVNDMLFEDNTIKLNRIWNFGAGYGLQYMLFSNVAVNFDIGIYYQISDESEGTNPFFDRDPEGTSFFGIGGGIGFRFSL